MMRKTGGTARTSVEMSCLRSWPFERVGWRRYGKPWRRWRPGPWQRRSRLIGKEAIIPGCLMTGRSGTSPTGTPASCPAREGGTSSSPTTVRRWVDSTHQVIVAARATNATSDKQQAVAMVEETTGNVGAVPREVSADAGYYSVKAVEELYALGANPFIAPEQTRHGRVLEPAPRGRIPKGLSVRDRMRRKLRTKRGRERYALRMETVEPVFGQIKQGRGFRQFLLRGLAKVNREWLLICAGHNLLKLFRFGAGMSGNVRGKGANGNNKESCQAMGSGVFERRPGYVHPHHAGFVATGGSWPINRVSWSILRQPALAARPRSTVGECLGV